MKRLALAASIALAVSTIGVGPAVANSLDTSPELTTQENVQPPGDEAEDTPDAADPGGNDTATGPGTEDAKGGADKGQEAGQDATEAADPGVPTTPGEESADSDDNKDDATEDPADDSADGAEESEPIEANFALEKTTMTAEDIGDPNKGIRYTIDSLKAGDVVTAEPGEDTSTTVEEDGAFTGAIVGNTELKTGDTLDVTVTVEREGQESHTFSGSIEVVAADDEDEEAPDVELTVSPKKQGLHQFLNDGVDITLVNCVVDEEVTFRVSTKSDPDTTVWEDTQMAGEDAAGFSTFIPDGEGGANWVGDYLVMASCGDQSAETTFTVTADDSVVDPKLKIDPQEISGEDFVDRDKGVTITVTECKPGSDVQFEVWGLEPSGKLYEQTGRANKNGGASVQIYGLENNPDAYAGTYKVIANCLDRELIDEFVVTGSGGGGAGDSESGSDNDSGNAGSMPRTGAELTGLGAGAALILGGAATIIFARRRSQTGQ